MAVLGSSGTTPPLLPDVLLTVSTTWSPPYKVKALVRVFGGGGSGAISQTDDKCWMATGGGAAEHAGSIFELDPDVAYTIVVGAGGVQRSATGTVGVAGAAGSLSSFAGSGITTITANGGGAGTILQATATDTAYTLAGAVGGSGGAGGLYRHTGGAGGAITKPSVANDNVSNNSLCTGGGAVGLFGTGFAGGLISYYNNATGQQIGTGGGGVNGVGGPVNANGSNLNNTHGGGTFGPAGNTDAPNSTPGFGHSADSYGVKQSDKEWEATFDFWSSGRLLDRINHTMEAVYLSPAPPGSGGRGSDGLGVYMIGTGASLFGGGGAQCTSQTMVDPATNNNHWFMAGGRLGGGGGAGGMTTAGSKRTNSGYGGRGGVLIEMLERIV